LGVFVGHEPGRTTARGTVRSSAEVRRLVARLSRRETIVIPSVVSAANARLAE
jgi:hypothetical protein